jgi:hypothetical protein
MEDSEVDALPRDEARSNRVREGFNEFFDWHMRGHIEYA